MFYFTVYQYILQYKTLDKIFGQKQKNHIKLDKTRILRYWLLCKFFYGRETHQAVGYVTKFPILPNFLKIVSL